MRHQLRNSGGRGGGGGGLHKNSNSHQPSAPTILHQLHGRWRGGGGNGAGGQGFYHKHKQLT